jgi:hypothetical protein
MVIPGSVGDWVQALIMTAALAGLAATGAWALREEEPAPSRRPRPSRSSSGRVDATAAAEQVEAMH